MSDISKHNLLRFRCLVLVVATAVVMAAGAASVDENRERFLQTSLLGRRELAESLRRFDHDLSDQQQQSLRAIDDRLKALPIADRERHLAVLRRFHNWIDGLPERVRDDLLARPADQRLGVMKTLIAKYPLPDLESRSQVEFIQTGGTGIFEVASLCKTWLNLSAPERQKLDASPAIGRRLELHRLGREHEVPPELIPADFDEKAWSDRAENRLKEIRDAGSAHKDWIAKLETRISEASAKRKGKGRDQRRPFLHRLAVNLYVQEHTAPPRVDADRLAAFFGAMPSWVQSTFNIFPGDEARRRLTLVYRLVYPSPQEFDPRPTVKPSAPSTKADGPQRPQPWPPPTAPAAPRTTQSAAPF